MYKCQIQKRALLQSVNHVKGNQMLLKDQLTLPRLGFFDFPGLE